MRKRLISLIKRWMHSPSACDGCEGLADYLLKNKVMVLPYSVGDTLYRVYDTHFIIKAYKIDTIMIAKDHVTVFDDCGNMYDSELIGDGVFLTLEEAEKALERRCKQ